MPILVALGGADCVWDDLKAAKALIGGRPYDVGAVNDAGAAYAGALTIWASLHPEHMGRWVQSRESRGYDMGFVGICHRVHRNYRPDRVVAELWSGSSGLYLAQIAARTYGYHAVICCGMPMTATPHFFAGKPWDDARNFQRGWRKACGDEGMSAAVRSMSGFSAETFGRPTADWLRAKPD